MDTPNPIAIDSGPIDCDHDDPDLRELAELFVEEMPDRIDALRGAFDADRLNELQTLAHQLKGAGGGYGYPRVTREAAALEAAVKACDGTQTRAALNTLTQTLGRLCVTTHRANRAA